MTANKKYPGKLIFGLDIGTRSVVGTVGYRSGDSFYVLAEEVREHETRAMLDGQIHDIEKVSSTIADVKMSLELKLEMKLKDVCIAAAGRVLKTHNVSVETEFAKDITITQEEIFTLTSRGVEKAFSEFQEEVREEEKFYCVGYSVIRYYLNGNPISNLESHKAKKIGVDLIATFLPDDVVDGLYRSVEAAGLNVVNLTLEPIAAIEVAIPEKFRMLNIALVDVGAGTSDICITKDGSIAAYGMIPCAGDRLTDKLSQHCLVEFAVAEQIKRGISTQETVHYDDIMCLPQKISRKEVLEILNEDIDEMTQLVADRILALNGDKPVSAVFVVGGGGKIAGYTQLLAKKLGIDVQRVALRGEEVMQKIIFPEDIKKDSLLVTPIGICLNYYEQNNNFICIIFNNERIKLYDNNHLAVVDAAMQANFPTESLFPKRGKELNYTVNKNARITRGEVGEPARIEVNGSVGDINTPLHANDIIRIEEATPGEAAHISIGQFAEHKKSLTIKVNGKKVKLPVFAAVNGKLEPETYEVKEGDQIEFLDFYTVNQILTFLDMQREDYRGILVNNEQAEKDTGVFEQFSLVIPKQEQMITSESSYEEEQVEREDNKEETMPVTETTDEEKPSKNRQKTEETATFAVMVNKAPVVLSGKREYVYVDVFDAISFDLTKSLGRSIITKLNGRTAQYMEPLNPGDNIEIYWNEM